MHGGPLRLSISPNGATATHFVTFFHVFRIIFDVFQASKPSAWLRALPQGGVVFKFWVLGLEIWILYLKNDFINLRFGGRDPSRKIRGKILCKISKTDLAEAGG